MNYEYSYSIGTNSVDPELAKGMAILGLGFLAFIFLLVIIVYIYMAICLMKMAKKTNTEDAWMAWIPIFNLFLMVKIAKKPGWWTILLLIPVINIFANIIVWMAIAKELKKPEWLGILMIVPIANFIVPGYLAFPEQKVISPQSDVNKADVDSHSNPTIN